MKLTFIVTAFTLLTVHLFGIEASSLQRGFQSAVPLFNYPLNITVYPSNNPDAGATVCLHGRGADYTTGGVICRNIDEHVVSFNFPDAATLPQSNEAAFGTIREILPAIYVIKQCIVSCGLDSINLYGFSAGGGTLVNMLAVLNRGDYDAELKSIGITPSDKQLILQAVQRGYVIIDSPLKSIDEIIALRGQSPELDAFAQVYAANRLRPIDSLNDLQGLSLTVLLNFQDPDRAVSNRDDKLYANRLKSVNQAGHTTVIISHDEGHVSYHPELWKAYRQMKTASRQSYVN